MFCGDNVAALQALLLMALANGQSLQSVICSRNVQDQQAINLAIENRQWFTTQLLVQAGQHLNPEHAHQALVMLQAGFKMSEKRFEKRYNYKPVAVSLLQAHLIELFSIAQHELPAACHFVLHLKLWCSQQSLRCLMPHPQCNVMAAAYCVSGRGQAAEHSRSVYGTHTVHLRYSVDFSLVPVGAHS